MGWTSSPSWRTPDQAVTAEVSDFGDPEQIGPWMRVIAQTKPEKRQGYVVSYVHVRSRIGEAVIVCLLEHRGMGNGWAIKVMDHDCGPVVYEGCPREYVANVVPQTDWGRAWIGKVQAGR